MFLVKFSVLYLLLTGMFSAIPELNAQEINWSNNGPYDGRVWALAEAPVAASTFTNDNVTLVSRALLGPAEAVFVAGDCAYVGTGGAFVVFDVSNPELPTIVSKVYVPDIIKEIVI
jgi:hypothetical protein